MFMNDELKLLAALTYNCGQLRPTSDRRNNMGLFMHAALGRPSDHFSGFVKGGGTRRGGRCVHVLSTRNFRTTIPHGACNPPSPMTMLG